MKGEYDNLLDGLEDASLSDDMGDEFITDQDFNKMMEEAGEQETAYEGPVYEIVRTSVKPQFVSEFLQWYPKLETKRELEGKLFGSFQLEFGRLNEFIHIWEWRDIKHRQIDFESACKLPQYKEIESTTNQYIASQFRSLWGLDTQISDSFMKKEDSGQGVYEIEMFDNRYDVSKSRSLKKAAGGFIVAGWSPLVHESSENEVFNLWRFDSLDHYENYVKSMKDLNITLELSEEDFTTQIIPNGELLSPCIDSPLF